MSTHTAILVTAATLVHLGPAYVEAHQRGLAVSPLMPSPCGTRYTFVILPTANDAPREGRTALCAALTQANADAGRTVLEWVEVEYGTHVPGGRVLAHVPPTPPVTDDDWLDDRDDVEDLFEDDFEDEETLPALRSRVPRYDECDDDEDDEETFTRL